MHTRARILIIFVYSFVSEPRPAGWARKPSSMPAKRSLHFLSTAGLINFIWPLCGTVEIRRRVYGARRGAAT